MKPNMRRFRKVPIGGWPDGYVQVIGCTIDGKPTLLCPVNKANKLPKTLKLNVQFEFEFAEQHGSKVLTVAPDGSIIKL